MIMKTITTASRLERRLCAQDDPLFINTSGSAPSLARPRHISVPVDKFNALSLQLRPARHRAPKSRESRLENHIRRPTPNSQALVPPENAIPSLADIEHQQLTILVPDRDPKPGTTSIVVLIPVDCHGVDEGTSCIAFQYISNTPATRVPPEFLIQSFDSHRHRRIRTHIVSLDVDSRTIRSQCVLESLFEVGCQCRIMAIRPFLRSAWDGWRRRIRHVAGERPQDESRDPSPQ